MTRSSEVNKELSLPEALARGDEGAVTLFYRDSGPVLFTVCRRYASSQEEAEDFFQEGFLHILAQVKKFKGQSSLQTWSYRVMANFCMNQLRRASAKIVWVSADDANLKDEADEHYEENEAYNMETVLGYMQEMPAGFRLVMNMYAIDQKSHAEIAAALGISENTSKSQLFKARRWLKQRMAGKGEYHG